MPCSPDLLGRRRRKAIAPWRYPKARLGPMEPSLRERGPLRGLVEGGQAILGHRVPSRGGAPSRASTYWHGRSMTWTQIVSEAARPMGVTRTCQVAAVLGRPRPMRLMLVQQSGSASLAVLPSRRRFLDMLCIARWQSPKILLDVLRVPQAQYLSAPPFGGSDVRLRTRGGGGP